MLKDCMLYIFVVVPGWQSNPVIPHDAVQIHVQCNTGMLVGSPPCTYGILFPAPASLPNL